jgi:WD40 repeat protein
LIAHSFEGVIAIWDGITLTEDRQLCTSGSVSIVSWSHDSCRVMCGSQNCTFSIWDPKSGTLLHTLIGHHDTVGLAFWNHDDSLIFSGSFDQTIRIWDGTTGQLLKTECIDGLVDSMSLTKEEDRLAFSTAGPFIRCLTLLRM